jgi:hypothetical protein
MMLLERHMHCKDAMSVFQLKCHAHQSAIKRSLPSARDSFCNPENLKFHDFGGACEKKFVTLAVAEITSIATLLSKFYESHSTGAMMEFQ